MVGLGLNACSVEVDSEMSEEYRATLLRLMANQAYAELCAAKTYARWIAGAPGAEERRVIGAMVHEEVEHWYGVIKLMEALGVNSSQVPSHQSRQLLYPIARIFVLRFRWSDVLMSAFLIDRAGYFLLEDYGKSSYAPWAREIRRTIAEEEEHAEFGQRFIVEQVEKLGRERIRRALRKWWPIALNAFGPPLGANHEKYVRLGLKRRTNDERRQRFIDDLKPRIEELGFAVPSLYRDRFPFF